jgi:hemoglobin-like flavoprotein
MTPEQIYLVRSTWEQVVPTADTAAQLFYGRLVELKPELRGLLQHADMPEQGRKLIQMLAVAVVSLDKLDAIRPALENLGRRHVDYRLRDHHYDLGGAALLWTLEQGLGDGFTVSVRDAWTEAYTALATIMRTAAADGERAA